MMERLNRGSPSAEQGRKSKQEVIRELSELGSKLLEEGTQMTPSWKRSSFAIPQNQVSKFYNEVITSSFGDLFKNLKGYRQKEGSDKPYDFEEIGLTCEDPTAVTLQVEQTGYAKYTKTSFGIAFSYGEGYYLMAQLSNHVQRADEIGGVEIEPYDYWDLSSTSYQYSLTETGYEGSDLKQIDYITKNHFENFLNIFRENRGTQIKEHTIDERLSGLKMINNDTNEVFYYDPERKGYFNAEGKPMEEDEGPLANLPSNGALKVLSVYSMVPLVEGEINPFVLDR